VQHLVSGPAGVAAALALVTVLTVSASSEARSFRVEQIPNGRKRSCLTCHGTDGGVVFNGFGSAVRSALAGEGPPQDRSVDWSLLWSQDSDGDGLTNGAELGDPNGTWRIGDPDPAGVVTSPGDPNNATTDGGCGDGILGAAETCDSDQLRGATCESQNLGQGEMLCGLDCRLDTTNCDRSTKSDDEGSAPPEDDGGCAVTRAGDGNGALASSALAVLFALALRRRARTRR
jgi:hypothetical protein